MCPKSRFADRNETAGVLAAQATVAALKSGSSGRI
jgi:hypothetical protein